MLFPHWLPRSPSAARKGPEPSTPSGIPGNRHTTGNFSALRNLEVTVHTFRCPLDCQDSLWLIATWILEGQSLPVNPQPSCLRSHNWAFLANQNQPNCYEAGYSSGAWPLGCEEELSRSQESSTEASGKKIVMGLALQASTPVVHVVDAVNATQPFLRCPASLPS